MLLVDHTKFEFPRLIQELGFHRRRAHPPENEEDERGNPEQTARSAIVELQGALERKHVLRIPVRRQFPEVGDDVDKEVSSRAEKHEEQERDISRSPTFIYKVTDSPSPSGQDHSWFYI